MDTLRLIRDMIFRAWAEIASSLGLMDRHIGETDYALVRRGVVKTFIVHTTLVILLIATAFTTGGSAWGFLSVVMLALVLLSLAMFWATTTLLPATVAHIVRVGGLLPDANILGTLVSPIPTFGNVISGFRAVALWETVLALYVSIARQYGADMTLVWVAIMAVVVIVLSGAGPKGSAKVLSVIGKVVVIVTIILQFSGSIRDAFFNRSYMSFVSPSRERVENEALSRGLDGAIKSGDESLLKRALEIAPLNSDEEGMAYQALMDLCHKNLECLSSTRAYVDGVVGEKKPRRAETPPSPTTPVAEETPAGNRRRRDMTATPTEKLARAIANDRLDGEIPYLSLDGLREVYVFYAPDGRFDDIILPRALALGADDYELRDWETDRENAQFFNYPNGRIEKMVFWEDWSPRVLTGGRDKWRYFVDGTRIWNAQNNRGEVIRDAGVNMRLSFMRGAQWLKFQVDESDLDAGQDTVWVVRR